jgi:hypothetical protein
MRPGEEQVIQTYLDARHRAECFVVQFAHDLHVALGWSVVQLAWRVGKSGPGWALIGGLGQRRFLAATLPRAMGELRNLAARGRQRRLS